MEAQPTISPGPDADSFAASGGPPEDTLAPLLWSERVPMETLHQRYGPMLEFVRILIGVVPNCDPYLEIWPPAFRSYNLMVPNLLNLPFSVLGVGSAPTADVGLAMYVASRAAECPYCSAHTCSYALRRGAVIETVARALDPDRPFTAREKAVIAVARSLARVPCELDDGERHAFDEQLTPGEREWIVHGIVNMGFLNKFMDAIGVELEASTVAETQATMGEDWTPGKASSDLPDSLPTVSPPSADTIWTKLSVLPHVPGALRLDQKWQRGVPSTWPAVAEYLKEQVGHDFPVLSRFQAKRVIRAVATMIRDNLDAETTVLGLPEKVMAGSIFCAVIDDDALAQDVARLGERHGVTEGQREAAFRFGKDPSLVLAAVDERSRVIFRLARAASPSPAQITADLVAECRAVALKPAEIVELICWLSVLQMLHRLTSYFR